MVKSIMIKNYLKYYIFIIFLLLNTGCSSTNKKWYSNEYSENEIKNILYKCNRDAKNATNTNKYSGSNKRWALIGVIVSANEESSLFDECVHAYNLSTEPPKQTELSILHKKNNIVDAKEIFNTEKQTQIENLIVGTWIESTPDYTDKTTYYPNNLFTEIGKLTLPNGEIKNIVFSGKWEIKESLLTLEISSTTIPKLISKGFKFSMRILLINDKELRVKDFMENKIITSYRVKAIN